MNKEYLDECLTYKPKTGKFFWKERPLKHFKNYKTWKMWNTSWSGKQTGSICRTGYMRITLLSKVYYALRGVYYVPYENAWVAQISVKGIQIYLGYFRNKNDAITARRTAELKYHKEFAPIQGSSKSASIS